MNQGGLPNSIILDTVIPSSVSCAACVWLFFSYPKLAKSTGLKMIFTLSMSDFIYHLSVLLTLLQLPGIFDTIARVIVAVSIQFSIFWPPAIAYLVYKSSRQTDFINTEKYFKCSLLAVTLLSVIISEARNILRPSSSITALAITTSFMFISMGFTFFCYFSCIRVLERLAKTMVRFPKSLKTRNLYLYSLIQFITICPFMTYLFVNQLTGTYNQFVFKIFLILINTTGLINVLVYFVLRKPPQKENKKDQNGLRTDESLSIDSPLLPEAQQNEHTIL